MTAPDAGPRNPLRRHYGVAVVVGTAAATAGIGAALWSAGPQGTSLADLWSLRFVRPDGGELALAPLRGRPLLLNFWATWCAPCVTEMPLLAAFRREHRAAGWEVVGLAVDQSDPVRRFIAEHHIEFPIGLAGAAGIELARSFGNTTGGLPFSLAVGADGQVRERKLGALDGTLLARWARAA